MEAVIEQNLATRIKKGEIVQPIVFLGETPNFVGYVAKKESGHVSDKTEVTFAPSKDLAFKFSKDADCNIDIWIHTNPKNIKNTIKAAMKTTKFLSKIMK